MDSIHKPIGTYISIFINILLQTIFGKSNIFYVYWLIYETITMNDRKKT